MLNETLTRALQMEVAPAEERAMEFKVVMRSYMVKLLTLLRNDTYFGSLLNVGKGDQLLLFKTAPERFEARIVLKNLWRLMALHLDIRLAEGGAVSLEPKMARDIESRMVLARVLHPLYDMIRPTDVIILFTAAVRAAVPKVVFQHPFLGGAPQVAASNGSVRLVVAFKGRNVRLDLTPVFQFPWAFLPSELKASRHIKGHCKSENFSWMAVPPSDPAQLTWAIEFNTLEHEFRGKRNLKKVIRLIQAMAPDLSQRLVLQAFLWLDEERGDAFWSGGLAHVVVEVVEFLYQAHHHAKLNNFWLEDHELMGADTQATADRLHAVLDVLRSPDVSWDTVSALFQ